MTGMLASVNSLHEAETVAAERVDIIDLKEPRAGALGGLPLSLVGEIVTALKGRCPLSATIGDLPLYPEPVLAATQAMAATGVDYIKIGFFPDGDIASVLTALKPIGLAHRLIAVLFADTHPDPGVVERIVAANFSGVMLDTMDKSKGSLTSLMSLPELSAFVEEANRKNLLCGLAGSLTQRDIPLLLPLQPDYLGFRSALCLKNNRVKQLSVQAVQTIRDAIAFTS